MIGAEPHGRPGANPAPGLVGHFFRHEYGRLVALLTRKAGVRHIDVVEDAVQGALVAALTAWPAQGLPDDPGAWLYRVAFNNLTGALRRNASRLRILERTADTAPESEDHSAASYFSGEVADDMLRMLFICCDDAIPKESRLVLALKTLCGFSVREIALRLFTTEANVYKRLARAKDRLRETMLERIDPSPTHTMNRAVAVAEWQGPEAGLALLETLAPPAWLAGSCLWDAVLGDLHRRVGNLEVARPHTDRALASAPTEAVRNLIRRRQPTVAAIAALSVVESTSQTAAQRDGQ